MNKARRLRADLREMMQSQATLPFSAQPATDDLAGPWTAVFHADGGDIPAQVTFPEEYPFKPPSVRVALPHHHSNVSADGDFCLQLLREGDFDISTGGIAPYSGWTPAYTIQGVLMQVHASLFAAENGTFHPRGTPVPCVQVGATLAAARSAIAEYGGTLDPAPITYGYSGGLAGLDLGPALNVVTFMDPSDYHSVACAFWDGHRLVAAVRSAVHRVRAMAELRCFVTKVGPGEVDGAGCECMLGLPVRVSYHPKYKRIEQLHVSGDVLSYDAFESGVRTDPWGAGFTHWLPLYINPRHWARARRALQRVCVQLSDYESSVMEADPEVELMLAKGLPGRMSSARSPFNGRARKLRKARGTHELFRADMALNLLCKALAGTISKVAADGQARNHLVRVFCMLHRTLLACVEEWPVLRSLADAQLSSFARSEAGRVKTAVPMLGDLFQLFLVSDRLNWPEMSSYVLEEAQDRGAMWMLRSHPELGDEDASISDEEYCHKAFMLRAQDGSWRPFGVVLKSVLWFVHNIGKPPGVSLREVAAKYDERMGMADVWQEEAFQSAVKGYAAHRTWEQHFEALGLPHMNAELQRMWLERSVHNSLRKKYMTQRMMKGWMEAGDVMGVHGLRRAQLTVSWQQEVKRPVFLDVCALLYSSEREFIDQVDFATRRPFGITHSGDQMESVRDGPASGTQMIDIPLTQLPERVQFVLLSVSVWNMPLSCAVGAHALLRNGETGNQVAAFSFGSLSESATIAGVLYRERQQWLFKATDVSCAGDTRDVAPILDAADALLGRQPTTAARRVREISARLPELVELCFVVDLTSSMSPYIDQLKQTLQTTTAFISGWLRQQAPERESRVRVAVCGYRDYDFFEVASDPPWPRIESIDFTEDVDVVTRFVSGLLPMNGGGAEDMAGGLNEALALSWSTAASVRCVVVIADAPCHGAMYSGMDDEAPGGDPAGLTMEMIARELHERRIGLAVTTMLPGAQAGYGRMVQSLRSIYDNTDASLVLTELKLHTLGADTQQKNLRFAQMVTGAVTALAVNPPESSGALFDRTAKHIAPVRPHPPVWCKRIAAAAGLGSTVPLPMRRVPAAAAAPAAVAASGDVRMRGTAEKRVRARRQRQKKRKRVGERDLLEQSSASAGLRLMAAAPRDDDDMSVDEGAPAADDSDMQCDPPEPGIEPAGTARTHALRYFDRYCTGHLCRAVPVTEQQCDEEREFLMRFARWAAESFVPHRDDGWVQRVYKAVDEDSIVGTPYYGNLELTTADSVDLPFPRVRLLVNCAIEQPPSVAEYWRRAALVSAGTILTILPAAAEDRWLEEFGGDRPRRSRVETTGPTPLVRGPDVRHEYIATSDVLQWIGRVDGGGPERIVIVCDNERDALQVHSLPYPMHTRTWKTTLAGRLSRCARYHGKRLRVNKVYKHTGTRMSVDLDYGTGTKSECVLVAVRTHREEVVIDALGRPGSGLRISEPFESEEDFDWHIRNNRTRHLVDEIFHSIRKRLRERRAEAAAADRRWERRCEVREVQRELSGAALELLLQPAFLPSPTEVVFTKLPVRWTAAEVARRVARFGAVASCAAIPLPTGRKRRLGGGERVEEEAEDRTVVVSADMHPAVVIGFSTPVEAMTCVMAFRMCGAQQDGLRLRALRALRRMPESRASP